MRKQLVVCLIWIFLLAGLSGCARQPVLSLPEAPGLHGEAFIRTELFFGMSFAAAPDHPAGLVTEAQWQDFVDTWITPSFPDGLTVIDGYGQWLGGNGIPVKEHSKILILLHPASTPDEWARADSAIETIRAAYCRLFHQDSVLRATSRASVAF